MLLFINPVGAGSGKNFKGGRMGCVKNCKVTCAVKCNKNFKVPGTLTCLKILKLPAGGFFRKILKLP